jgi:hypothetical protein
VLRPGFEPGSAAREAVILNRTILPEPKLVYFLLTFPVYSHFVRVTVSHIVKACLDQLRLLFQRLSRRHVPFIALEADEMRIDLRVLELLMSKQSFDMEYVFWDNGSRSRISESIKKGAN